MKMNIKMENDGKEFIVEMKTESFFSNMYMSRQDNISS